MDSTYFKSEIPTGRCGEWLLECFEVREAPVSGPRSPDAPACSRPRPGSYSRLKRGDTVFMTDLYDEWYTQKIAIDQACRRGGHVLISGLGLGMIVESILRAPSSTVERITVLELSPEVIELVAPHVLARYPGRLEILEADVFAWQPPEGARYTVVWHDIWPNPQAPEALTDMEVLEERYRPVCEWHGCWPREWRWIHEQLPWDRDGAAP
ncbi:MAG: hypothetical protein GY719_29745 [bacterium]|nr:hypothetical protein [bacterium]